MHRIAFEQIFQFLTTFFEEVYSFKKLSKKITVLFTIISV